MGYSSLHAYHRHKPLLILLSLTIAVIVAFLFPIQQADAYHLEGYRWSGQPTSGCCGVFHVYYYPMFSQDVTGWDNGASAWNNTISANVEVFSDGSCCTITADDENNGSVTWDGLTNYSYNGKSFISAHLFLNFHYTQHYSAGEIQSVSAHELGHMMGLAHTSGCVLMVGDTPTRWTSCGINAPVSDDINGVNSLY